MADQIIPLSSAPNQTLTVALNVNGNNLGLKLNVAYNPMGAFWVLNIFTTQGVPIIQSVPLITGTWPGANVLAPFQYLLIGSAYVINITGVSQDYPDNTNLGGSFALLWGDNVQ